MKRQPQAGAFKKPAAKTVFGVVLPLRESELRFVVAIRSRNESAAYASAERIARRIGIGESELGLINVTPFGCLDIGTDRQSFRNWMNRQERDGMVRVRRWMLQTVTPEATA